MHDLVRENLESYLAGAAGGTRATVEAHLASCEECKTAVAAFRGQSSLLRTLRPATDVEPRAGFYARVMEQIEAQRHNSFWGIFLDPMLGRRLVLASAALVVLCGTYLMTAQDEPIATFEEIAAAGGYAEPGPSPMALQVVNTEPDPDAVLVNLTSYQD